MKNLILLKEKNVDFPLTLLINVASTSILLLIKNMHLYILIFIMLL